jgi:uncharacterized membrane protein YdjX (TVP38/TMEM64 family)
MEKKNKKRWKNISHHISRIRKSVNDLRQFEWKHQNLIFLIVSLIVAYVFIESTTVHEIIKNIGAFGYAGTFFAGMFFSYALTAAPASAALFLLGNTLRTPFIIAVIGACGAMISDYLIFRFVRDRLMKEIRTTEKEILGNEIQFKINPKGLAAKLIPILAGIIIASPLPDELGVALLGASKIRTRKFLQYSFILNLLGIFVITSIAAASV